MGSLSYKQKTWLLYLLLVLLSYLMYKKMFVATIQLVETTNELTEKLESESTGVGNVKDLQSEMARYDKIALHTDSMVDPASEVLNFLSTVSSGTHVKVETVDPTTSQEVQAYRINSFTVKISGDYISLLKSIDLMEKRVKTAKLASTRFFSEQKNDNTEPILYAELILQYITKK